MTYLIRYTIADSNDFEYRVCTLFETPAADNRRILLNFLVWNFDGAVYHRGSRSGMNADEALDYLERGKSVRIEDDQLLQSIEVIKPTDEEIAVLRVYLD